MKWSKISIGILLWTAYLVLPGCCSGETNTQHPVDVAIQQMDTLYQLDQHKTEVSQPVGSEMLSGHTYQFVQVDVTRVINPQKYPLIFYVYYQYPGSEKFLLGSFSLFPADNPGKFIVATQGRLNKEGSVILSLTSPQKIKAGAELRVILKKITLRDK